MNNTNWDTFRCRCSAIQKIIANSRSNPVITEKQALELAELEKKSSLTAAQSEKMAELMVKRSNLSKVILSDTCIDYLMEVYSWETTGKIAISKELDMEQVEKGKAVEDDSIALLSVVEGILYEKNEERVYNDFLSGEPDIFVGENIMQAEKITDVKSCWDYPGFLKKINKGLDNGYEEQLQGYCDITGATEAEVAYCLVDMPEVIKNDYKRRLFYKGDYVTEESPAFLQKWAVFERSMSFTDIPVSKRVFKVKIDTFPEEKRRKVYDRVKICREWLWKFDEMYQMLNN